MVVLWGPVGGVVLTDAVEEVVTEGAEGRPGVAEVTVEEEEAVEEVLTVPMAGIRLRTANL